MDFDNAYSFELDFAFSAGTILALMPNKIVGFPNAHVDPVLPPRAIHP
jgi:hypothetical protein